MPIVLNEIHQLEGQKGTGDMRVMKTRILHMNFFLPLSRPDYPGASAETVAKTVAISVLMALALGKMSEFQLHHRSKPQPAHAGTEINSKK